MTTRPGILSVDELVKRKREEKLESNRPRFLSKAERQKLALERRQAQYNRTEQKPTDTTTYSNPPSNENAASSPKRNESRRNSVPNIPRNKKEKFRFGWSEEDDTLQNDDPLYIHAREASHKPLEYKSEGDGVAMRLKRQMDTNDQSLKRSRKDWDEIHWTKKPLENMKERDWRIFREDFEIVTRGSGDLPHPLRSWKESSIPKSILSTIDSLQYKEPTPIQRAAIPIALASRDVIGVAETGSGKTASFVIPMLTYIMSRPRLTALTKTNGPYAVVLAPTRELAQQIESETAKFCKPLGFRCLSIVGGHSFEEQVFKLEEGAEIVIATPGRLVDCLERHVLVLNQCYYVVMDEADRMIDLGFEESMTKILGALGANDERRTMMYTATMPPSIERLAQKYLDKPGTVIIGNRGQATDNVEQRVEIISSEEKRMKRMLDILNSNSYKPPIIIFVNYKRNCDLAVKELQGHGWNAVSMHGGKSQEMREQALSQLRSGEADVLVATDVAGRGIDVQNVSLVINLQMSKGIEPYTHRIGRTGRAGKRGVAVTFVDPVEDADVLYDLRMMIQESPVSRVPPEFKKLEAAKFRPVKGA